MHKVTGNGNDVKNSSVVPTEEMILKIIKDQVCFTRILKSLYNAINCNGAPEIFDDDIPYNGMFVAMDLMGVTDEEKRYDMMGYINERIIVNEDYAPASEVAEEIYTVWKGIAASKI